MAASALLSPVRPLAGTTRSGEIWGSTGRRRFPSVFPTKTREGSQRCGSTELLMKEKYRPYYPQAAVMCQLAASTLCKHTKNTALQRVVMVMIPQGVRLYIRKDSIAYCLPMQLSQARVFRSSTAPDKGNLFVYSSIDSCHVEKAIAFMGIPSKDVLLQHQPQLALGCVTRKVVVSGHHDQGGAKM
uniref:Uncharacterized protein n=1 Tax=Oryza barthii TaxID=65489 RepID=A0A0D3HQ98_9ORYZ